jgi:hypothetical protein
LINHIAHAKAIDRIQPGYLNHYIAQLSQQGPNENPAQLPGVENPLYWSDAVMQDQTSFFNQMISISLALNLSHLYLDHYTKYAAFASDGKAAPINNFIGLAEWKASVKHAALNSLDCALGTAGAEALFDCVDQMPQRPAWTSYIVPEGVNIKALNKQLAQCEEDYYVGNSNLSHPRRTWTLLAGKDGSPTLLASQSAVQLSKQ